AGAEAAPLPDRDARGNRLDRRLGVALRVLNPEEIRAGVHDRAVVVVAEGPRARGLRELVLLLRDHVVPEDLHVVVAVRAALLVKEADAVADLMDHVAGRAVGADVDELLAALHADPRRALGGALEGDVVRLVAPPDEADLRVCLPVSD